GDRRRGIPAAPVAARHPSLYQLHSPVRTGYRATFVKLVCRGPQWHARQTVHARGDTFCRRRRELPGCRTQGGMTMKPAAASDAALLFDLDGTLVDTAPDLLRAANRLRAAHALPPLPLAQFRPVVSRGGAAMLLASL